MPCKFIRKHSILDTISKRKVGQGQQKAKSNNVGKEKTGYLRHSCLIAIALQGRKQGFLGLEILTPSRPWPQLQTSPCQVCSWARAPRTSIPFVLSSGPLRKPWAGLTPNSWLLGANAIGSVHGSHYKKTQLIDSNALPNLTL